MERARVEDQSSTASPAAKLRPVCDIVPGLLQRQESRGAQAPQSGDAIGINKAQASVCAAWGKYSTILSLISSVN